MTEGQQLALDEIALIQRENPHAVEIVAAPAVSDEWLIVRVSIHIGPTDSKPGGLPLRERETFIVCIPTDYPFSAPDLLVSHHRFQSFPHVCWRTSLCIYQSELEWNPADGMFGFFERVALWLHRASQNDMDPVQGPLEPPHYVTHSTARPLLLRANAPVEPGNVWVGWAALRDSGHVQEVTDWVGFSAPSPPDRRLVPAIFMKEALPMEFPRLGKDIFAELEARGVDRNIILSLLVLSAIYAPEGESGLIVVGLPMRRAADGSRKQHVAAWVVSAETLKSMRLTIPDGTDTEELRRLRGELADAVYGVISIAAIEWCKIFEDRDEIVVRRDARRPLSWFLKKKVLILGCGALGSWAAEVIARARPTAIDIVDNGVVKPGILARQNYVTSDIGAAKSTALAHRIKAISPDCAVTAYKADANEHIEMRAAHVHDYDLVLDCTASHVVSMKLERSWSAIGPHVRHFASFVINAKADCAIGIFLPPDAQDGPWSAYSRIKSVITTGGRHHHLVDSFYATNAIADLFQPEPGCSDPTFSGSTADAMGLVSAALNLVGQISHSKESSCGFACSVSVAHSAPTYTEVFALPELHSLTVDGYRILISDTALTQARAFVRQNQRIRSAAYETGGLLWGYWDTAAKVVIVLDASGPPPDSIHQPAHFQCGTVGTAEEHSRRTKLSIGACGFIGMWHTHPNVPPEQSREDMLGMTQMVARAGQNSRRALMIIFGREEGVGSAGIYIYEGRPLDTIEVITVRGSFLPLPDPVV